MDDVRSHLSSIVKECDAAEKTWSAHMKQPGLLFGQKFHAVQTIHASL